MQTNFTLAQLADKAGGGSPATVRKAVEELVADGRVAKLGPDPDHQERQQDRVPGQQVHHRRSPYGRTPAGRDGRMATPTETTEDTTEEDTTKDEPTEPEAEEPQPQPEPQPEPQPPLRREDREATTEGAGARTTPPASRVTRWVTPSTSTRCEPTASTETTANRSSPTVSRLSSGLSRSTSTSV